MPSEWAQVEAITNSTTDSVIASYPARSSAKALHTSNHKDLKSLRNVDDDPDC